MPWKRSNRTESENQKLILTIHHLQFAEGLPHNLLCMTSLQKFRTRAPSKMS